MTDDEPAPEEPAGAAESAVAGETAHPIEGQVLLLTAAKASVSADKLPELLVRTQEYLAGRIEAYRRQYERADADDIEAFLVPEGHWEALGDELGFERRGRRAVRRAHEEQLLRVGRREERREEFETAMEIREAVVVAVGEDASKRTTL